MILEYQWPHVFRRGQRCMASPTRGVAGGDPGSGAPQRRLRRAAWRETAWGRFSGKMLEKLVEKLVIFGENGGKTWWKSWVFEENAGKIGGKVGDFRGKWWKKWWKWVGNQLEKCYEQLLEYGKRWKTLYGKMVGSKSWMLGSNCWKEWNMKIGMD